MGPKPLELVKYIHWKQQLHQESAKISTAGTMTKKPEINYINPQALVNILQTCSSILQLCKPDIYLLFAILVML